MPGFIASFILLLLRRASRLISSKKRLYFLFLLSIILSLASIVINIIYLQNVHIPKSTASASYIENFPQALYDAQQFYIDKQFQPYQRTQVIFFSFFGRNGFGAQMLHLIDTVTFVYNSLALVNDIQFCIIERRYWNYGCYPNKGWSCYFSSFLCPDILNDRFNLKCTELSDINSINDIWTCPCINITTIQSRKMASQMSRYLADRREKDNREFTSTKFIRKNVKPIWKFNNKTEEIISKLKVETLGQVKNYIGIHVRRGDKISEARYVSTHKYIQAINQFILPNESVFVATDDTRVIKKFRKLLNTTNLITVEGLTEKYGHIQSKHNKKWLKGRYMEVIELLTEIELLKNSRVFIATFSSNLARLIYDLRNENETGQSSISLDDQWQPGNAWRTFGKPYCKWIHANQNFCNNIV